MRMIYEPRSFSQRVGSVCAKMNDLSDLQPSPDTMLSLADEHPTLSVFNRSKEPPENE
jgi:hypothetical protein